MCLFLLLILMHNIVTATPPYFRLSHMATVCELCYVIFANGVDFRRERLRM